MRGGRKLSLGDFDLDAFRDPGYHDPVARLAAMDRDGVDAEVLYSEVSAFRAFGLVKGDWRPISRAFTDHLSEFAAVDPEPARRLLPGADHRHRLRGRARSSGSPASARARCTCRTGRANSACPTTTKRATTRCGRCCRRPASRSATTSVTAPRSTTSSSATPPRRPASSPRCRRWPWPRSSPGGSSPARSSASRS